MRRFGGIQNPIYTGRPKSGWCLSDVVNNDNDDEAEFTDMQPVKKGKAAAQNKLASGIMNDYDKEDDDADFTDPTSDYKESNPHTPRAMQPCKVGPPTTVTNVL